jgi:hypothetical protein
MNPLYNPRQRKIYNDYNSWSSEKLTEIIKNGDNYNPDIIGIIAEILKERNVPLPGSFGPSADAFTEDTVVKEKPISEKEYNKEKKKREEKESKSRQFIAELREKPQEEIVAIITKYSFYEPEKLEAALTVAVDRGIISYDLRNSLQSQITENLNRHWDRKGRFAWEKNNAFMEFVSRYTDDEIYSIIEDPREIVIDVYHAVILTAMNRELIAKEDFNDYLEGAKSALRTDLERELDDFRKDFDLPESDEEVFDEETVVAESAKHWKCQECGELVDIELAICWNCQAEMPESGIVHPEAQEMRREMINEKKRFALHPVTAIFLIAAIMFVGDMARGLIGHGDAFHHKDFMIIDGIFLSVMVLWFAVKYFRIMKD